ncbi:MAG: hypothetical protein J6J79_01485 [Lachnospiraceae bacterium]|nr:hypothetical protein [Lachnospiraceae bacterium]
MIKKQPTEQFCNSHEVIRKYIDYVEMYGGDPTHHLARVSVGDKIRGKVLEVGVIVETNQSKVIICGDAEFCRDYHPEYTNAYQIFQSYASGTLIIRDTEDYAGNSVVIEISYYK